MRFRCPLCSKEIEVSDAQLGRQGPCPACGGAVFFPPTATPIAPPPPIAPPAPPPQVDNTLGGLIPYKNQSALIAYYLGVFSLIPCLGILLGIAALILGIKGLRFAKLHPEAKGKAHAWVGVIMGGFFALVYLAAVVVLIIGAACG